MNWAIWRPVAARYGTLEEVRKKWTIDDLLDSLDILDFQEECQRRRMETLK